MAVEEQVRRGALPRIEKATLAAFAQLRVVVEGEEAWVQVAGAGQPLGVEAIIAVLRGELRGRGLACIAASFFLLGPLAIEDMQRMSKVLIEFCSDLIVAQELPVGGRGVLAISSGFLQWALGVPSRVLFLFAPLHRRRFAIGSGETLLLSRSGR